MILRSSSSSKNGRKAEIDSSILSEEEQSKVLEDLRYEASMQNQFTRKAFAFLFYLVAIILTTTVIYSALFPWELQHQKPFEHIISNKIFELFYCGSIYCVLVASLIVDLSHCWAPLKKFGWIFVPTSYLFACANCIFWLFLFWKFEVSNPVLYWLPFADILILLLASYVDKDCKSLLSSTEELEKLKYNCKGV